MSKWSIRVPKTLFYGLVATVALCTIVLVTNIGFVSRVSLLIGQERLVTLVIYVAIWGMALGAVLIAAMQPDRIVRLFWATVIATSTAAGQLYYFASGSELSVFDVISLWSARHETGRAMAEYTNHVMLAGLMFAATFAVIMAFPSPSHHLIRRGLRWLGWTPAVPVAVIAAIILMRDGGGSHGMPSQFTPVAVTSVALAKVASSAMPDRLQVTSRPAGAPAARNIVMLVDESVRADYIDWRPGNPYTPRLAGLRELFVDFGASASGSNCSHYSNAILRLSGSRSDLVGSIKRNPSIWQYAKAAGYRTVFIDGQAGANKNPSRLQNFMTVVETNLIDRFVVVSGVDIPMLDYKLLDIVREELMGDEPVFIYANKNGAHFPYDTAFPASETVFKPSATKGQGKHARINAYRNSISWSVDRFFQQMATHVDLDDTLVFYTSDHGQTFRDGHLTHCTVHGPDPREALVPLFAVTGNRQLDGRLREAASKNVGKTTHFEIVPTVLDVMGFDPKLIAERHGASLFDTLDGETKFSTGDIFGLFRKDVNWTEIDLGKDYLEEPAIGGKPAATGPFAKALPQG